MKHIHVDEWYSAYLDGSLPAVQRQQVETHLRDCPRYAAEVEAARHLVVELHELPAPALPADFVAGVSARIAVAPRKPAWFPWRVPAFAGGMAVACALLTVFIFRAGPMTHLANTPSTAPTVMTKSADGASSSRTPQDAVLENGAPVAPAPALAGGNAKPPSTATSASGEPGRRDNLDAYDKKMILRNEANNNTGNKSTITAANDKDSAGRLYYEDDAPETARLRVEINALPMDKGMQTFTVTKSDDTPEGGTALPISPDPVCLPSPTSMNPIGPSGPAGPVGPAEMNFPNHVGVARNVQANPLILNGFTSLDATNNDCFQNASFGGLAVVNNAVPAKKYGNVSLRVDGRVPTRLQVDYARPALHNLPQVIQPPALVRQFDLAVPQSPEGAALRLQWSNGKTNDTYYLVVPGQQTRRTEVTFSNGNLPIIDNLLQLSNDLGLYIFCPSPFAESATRITVQQASPLQALNILAEQHQHRVSLCDEMINITSNDR